jgi:hypothetical protein
VYGLRFEKPGLEVMIAFENLFDIADVEFIVDDITFTLSKKFQNLSFSHFALGLESGGSYQWTKCMWLWLSLC